MKRLRWQLLVVALALGAIAILLLSQQPALLPGIAPEVKPTSGGVYTEALIGAFGRLNPVLDYYNSVDNDVDRLIFSGLVRFDDRGLPQGDLAETWGISQDGKVYNFSIRANAVWHDGTPVTCDDILFTVDLLRNEQIPLPADLHQFWKQIEVRGLDEKTLQFRLPEPFAPFMDYLAFGVLPKHALANLPPDQLITAPFNMEPIGSGPYRFDHLLAKDGKITGVVLSAFKNYYGNQPYITQVIFKYYPDAASALAAYRNAEVMGISTVTSDTLQAVLKEPALRVYTARLPRLTLIYLNLDKPELPFFKDPVLRRALLMDLNRQWLIDRYLSGQAILAHGPILPDTWAYYEGIEQLNYDPDAALSALKKAGYSIPAEGGSVRVKDGVALAFELAYPDQAPYTDIATYIQSNWQLLGIKVDLKPVPYDQLIANYLEPRTYQAALVDINLTRSPDPDPYPFWHQSQISNGQNYARWDDRLASEYVEQARVIVDTNERARRYRNFQVRFTTEMPALPLYYPVYSYAVVEQVRGIRMGPVFDLGDRFRAITSWFLTTKKTTASTPTPAP